MSHQNIKAPDALSDWGNINRGIKILWSFPAGGTRRQHSKRKLSRFQEKRSNSFSFLNRHHEIYNLRCLGWEAHGGPHVCRIANWKSEYLRKLEIWIISDQNQKSKYLRKCEYSRFATWKSEYIIYCALLTPQCDFICICDHPLRIKMYLFIHLFSQFICICIDT